MYNHTPPHLVAPHSFLRRKKKLLLPRKTRAERYLNESCISSACFKLVQLSPRTLQNIRKNWIQSPKDLLPVNIKLSTDTSPSSFQIYQTTADEISPHAPSGSHCIAIKTTRSSSGIFDIAFIDRPTLKLFISYRITATVIHTSDCILYTEAGENLIRFSTLPKNWTHCLKLESFPALHNATEERLVPDGLFLLHLHLIYLWTRIWFVVALQLVVDNFLGTSFIDRFNYRFFPWEKSRTLALTPGAILA